jgi:hypothetical protein
MGSDAMTDTEKLEAIRTAFGHETGNDAGINLLGAIITMDHNNWTVDEVCQRTLNRVLEQLKAVSDILKSSNPQSPLQ